MCDLDELACLLAGLSFLFVCLCGVVHTGRLLYDVFQVGKWGRKFNFNKAGSDATDKDAFTSTTAPAAATTTTADVFDSTEYPVMDDIDADTVGMMHINTEESIHPTAKSAVTPTKHDVIEPDEIVNQFHSIDRGIIMSNPLFFDKGIVRL